MRTYCKLALILVAILAMAGNALADATLSGATLGKHAAGPKLTNKDLEGRVVLWEFWGVNCGPCIANIPHITKLQEKYSRKQFVVVASHAQGGGPQKAGDVWKQHAGKDIVSVVDMANLPGSKGGGIPHCYLFDHTGKLMFDGHPAEVDKHVEAAVRKAPGFLVAGREFKELKSDAAKLGQMKGNLSSLLTKLRKVSSEADNKGKEEADFMLERVKDWADSTFKIVSENPGENPIETLSTVQEMTGYLKGDELGTQFVELGDKLKKDEKFQDEIKAFKLLDDIKSQAKTLGISADMDKEKLTRKQIGGIKSLASKVKSLKTKYPDSSAAKQAESLLTSWGAPGA